MLHEALMETWVSKGMVMHIAAQLEMFNSPFAPLHLQLCSWLTVRSMYTSEHKFSLQVS